MLVIKCINVWPFLRMFTGNEDVDKEIVGDHVVSLIEIKGSSLNFS